MTRPSKLAEFRAKARIQSTRIFRLGAYPIDLYGTKGRFLRELLYQGMFNQAISALGCERPFFPVKGAANYGLLYTILRLILDTDVQTVLELGAGQSSLLFDALKGVRPFSITTLESDSAWAAAVAQKVSHQVILAELGTQTVLGRDVKGYSIAADMLPHQRFDAVIVDGPNGTPRCSRWTSLRLLEQVLDKEFVVVFDDAERRGEQDTIFAASALLQKKANISTNINIARKNQVIFSTNKYRQMNHI